MAVETQDLAFFRQYVEQFNVLAERTNQLQLSINGFITPIPSGRTVVAALLVLASARLFPALCQSILLSRWKSMVLVVLLIEAIFYFYQRHRYAAANGVSTKCAPSAELLTKYREYLFSLDGCLETYVSGWFLDTPFDKVKQGNLLEYLSYILCYDKFQNIAARSKDEIKKLVNEFEQKVGRKFADGYDDSLQYMGHLWEPLRILHLPLVLYLLVEFVAYATELILWCLGFTKYRLDGMVYWMRDPDCITGIRDRLLEASMQRLHESFASLVDLDRYPLRLVRTRQRRSLGAHPPIVFMHGVAGLVLCLPFIKQMTETFQRHPVILLDIRHVGMRLCRRAKGFDEVAHSSAAILRNHNYHEACFIAHSYGTLVLTRMQQLYGQMVHSLVMMEPVNILPVWPLLLANFVYKVPPLTSLTSFRGAIIMLRALLSREVTVAETFCRRFMWHELIFWPQEIPSNCLVVLSGCDDLMPSPMIRSALQKASKARVVYRPFAHHGDVMINLSYQAHILAAAKQLVTDLGGGGKSKTCSFDSDNEDDVFYDAL